MIRFFVEFFVAIRWTDFEINLVEMIECHGVLKRNREFFCRIGVDAWKRCIFVLILNVIEIFSPYSQSRPFSQSASQKNHKSCKFSENVHAILYKNEKKKKYSRWMKIFIQFTVMIWMSLTWHEYLLHAINKEWNYLLRWWKYFWLRNCIRHLQSE